MITRDFEIDHSRCIA